MIVLFIRFAIPCGKDNNSSTINVVRLWVCVFSLSWLSSFNYCQIKDQDKLLIFWSSLGDSLHRTLLLMTGRTGSLGDTVYMETLLLLTGRTGSLGDTVYMETLLLLTGRTGSLGDTVYTEVSCC